MAHYGSKMPQVFKLVLKKQLQTNPEMNPKAKQVPHDETWTPK
jgi:hypothetical protein